MGHYSSQVMAKLKAPSRALLCHPSMWFPSSCSSSHGHQLAVPLLALWPQPRPGEAEGEGGTRLPFKPLSPTQQFPLTPSGQNRITWHFYLRGKLGNTVFSRFNISEIQVCCITNVLCGLVFVFSFLYRKFQMYKKVEKNVI